MTGRLMINKTLSITLMAALALAITGCTKSKDRPFADVTQPDRSQPVLTESDAQAVAMAEGERVITSGTQPATRPRDSVDQQTDAGPRSTTLPVDEPGTSRIEVVIEEPAVLVRQWPQSVAYRPSGDTLAFPTYWPDLEKAFRRDEYDNLYMEPLEFLFNTVALPVRAIITPPNTKTVYSPVGPTGHGPGGAGGTPEKP
jgi:hypothetical protein